MANDPETTSCETHLSRLFFTPDRVFKLLKPVRLPFVDFSDNAKRCAAATEEFERNREISPDVYLGLSDVFEDGELVDRMIVMRRLSKDRELRNLLNDGNDAELIHIVARHIAGMHAGLDPLSGMAALPASLDALAQNWDDNFDAIRPSVGRIIDPEPFHEVRSLAHSYMTGRSDLFSKRIADGWVRDGHGDLRAEHIYCTDDGPRMIDCVAFDDRLRISDVLADIAFLAMDLDRLVGSEAAVRLMKTWNEFTNEHHPSSLAHFYVAYRAHVRCKIACMRAVQGDAGAEDTARLYHEQALRHLQLARVRLVLVGGGPGTGKSTVAEGLAHSIGAVWLRADEIRKDIAGVAHDEHVFEEPGQGIYSTEVTKRVHSEIRRQAEQLLRLGTSVVIDTTFRSAEDRAALRELGSTCAARVDEFRCVVTEGVAKERIARRMASIYNPSDASPELVSFIADRFDAWPEAISIDTQGAPAESIRNAWQAVAQRRQPESPRRFVVDLATLRKRVLIETGID